MQKNSNSHTLTQISSFALRTAGHSRSLFCFLPGPVRLSIAPIYFSRLCVCVTLYREKDEVIRALFLCLASSFRYLYAYPLSLSLSRYLFDVCFLCSEKRINRKNLARTRRSTPTCIVDVALVSASLSSFEFDRQRTRIEHLPVRAWQSLVADRWRTQTEHDPQRTLSQRSTRGRQGYFM